ncbi:TonB-dependent receptor domain-containing protein [Paraflavitalea soli]|nr:TonB-dependent receptor [Paraflavitalea soli]
MKKGMNTNGSSTLIMTLILLCLMPALATAQVRLSGKVQKKEEALAWANVMLATPQGQLVTGAVTKADGSFELNAGKGQYRLTISFLGYANWQKEIYLEQDTAIGVVSLRPTPEALTAVTVVSPKKLIEYRPDRLVLNVENSVVATGGNAIQAISAAPGIVVQQNAISMLGKGAARVMVDGRIVELAGEDLVRFLESIPAGDIQRIEVMANPPAQYEAGGDGGLINIVLKKGLNNAWKNATTLAYDQNSYAGWSLSNTFLYNKNKWRVSLSGSGKLGDRKVMQGLTTSYASGPWLLDYTGRQKENNLSGRMTLDYELTRHTSIGVHYLVNTTDPDSRDRVRNQVFNTNGGLDSFLLNTGYRNVHTGSQTFNGHLVSKLDSAGRKLSVDVDYFRYNSLLDNNFAAATFTPNGQFLRTDQSARNVSNQHIDNGSVRVDMEHPLPFMVLGYGAKWSTTRSEGDIRYFNTITGTPVLDPKRSDEFVYRENNQAIYVNGSKAINKKWTLQAGLRLENTQTTGRSKTLEQTTRNNYLKLFPTVYVGYEPGNDHSFVLNYGRRINRPGFTLLNPFRSYINSTSYSEGNPFLQPAFSDNFELTHVYKGALRTNLFFNITTGGFGPVFTSNPQTNTLVISRQNYFKEYYYGIGESYSMSITPWWQSQSTVYLLGSKNRFADQINAIPLSGLQLYLSTNNTISFSSATKFQVDYMYSSPVKRGLYSVGYMSGLNIGLKQNLLGNKLTASLLVNDVFNTAWLKDYTSTVNGIKQVYKENNSSRFFRLSLVYQFGNNKINVKQRNFGNEEDRKRAN